MRKIENKNRESFDVIREHVSGEGDSTPLNVVQQAQLNRWNFYINLKLQGELKPRDIVSRMMKEFGVERATCFNDMGYAEALFGYNASLNKRFRIGARIDFIEEKIGQLWNKKYIDEEEDESEYGSETYQARMELAAKLETTLQKYYDIYPELKHSKSPRVINYNFTKNEYNVDELPDVDEAFEILKKEVEDGD